MQVEIECRFQLWLELRAGADGSAAPLHREQVSTDLLDLVDEAYTSAVLAEALAPESESLRARLRPVRGGRALAHGIVIDLQVDSGERCAQHFDAGRWQRRALALREQLRAAGAGGEVRSFLRIEAEGRDAELAPPPLQPPLLSERSLEDLGVRSLGPGLFVPDRPVLLAEDMVAQILDLTVAAGQREVGGGALGMLVRLPERLPGTLTRVVTVLTASVVDPRHIGTFAKLSFDPQALAEAAGVAERRGRGEQVLTAFHTHGWGRGCPDCRDDGACPLPPCTTVSLQDYQVCESLFPSKATLMPIAGRHPVRRGPRPELALHAWRGGLMRPIGWRSYRT